MVGAKPRPDGAFGSAPPATHSTSPAGLPTGSPAGPPTCPAALQVVILLYLFDNDTSFVVLLSSVLGTGIELWKVRGARGRQRNFWAEVAWGSCLVTARRR